MNLNTEVFGSGSALVVLIGEENGARFAREDCTILTISGFDWNEMLSPWPAPGVFSGGSDFAGHADLFLAELMKVVTDYRNTHEITHVYLAGYSLAGLFTLYACTKVSDFEAAASVSGSLWYENWVDYLKHHPVQAEYIYLSLGDREKQARNPLMKTVEERTAETRAIMAEYTEVDFVMNKGGHFNEEQSRMEKAIDALLNR